MDKLTDYLRYGDVIFHGVRYPADSIRSAVDDLAAYLRREHRGNSPFVYLFAPNHVKTVISYFAIIKAGFACVLLDPQVGRLELEEYEQDTPPGILIRINSATESFDKGAEIEFRDIRVRLKDDLEGVCTMVYTAADDGYAKAAMLTHENMLSNATAIYECNEVGKNSVSAAFLPISHLFGLQTGTVAPAIVNGKTILYEIDGLNEVSKNVKSAATRTATHIYGVPVVYYLLSRTPGARAIFQKAVRMGCGGYKLSQSIFQKVRSTLGHEIHEGYGLTEASPVCSWHRPGDMIKIGSVGRAFGDCELSVCNGQTKGSVSECKGRVCVRGRNVMKGYYGHPSLTRRALAGGRLHTRDTGRIDEDGYLHINTESKDFVNVGGRLAFVPEVERFILRVRNVKSAKVHSIPNQIQGGLLKARVEFRNQREDAESQLMSWMRENLSPYKIPRMVNAGCI